MNFGEIDVTNDQGKTAFRAALLKVADNGIQVLKDTGAQGMITWDPEGEEFPGACYYGDPRLVPTFAPEMEFKNNGKKSAIDEYFEKFRAAGFKVGICIRPQDVAIIDGKPVHQAADDEHAVRILRKKSPTQRSAGVAHLSMWIQPRLQVARFIRRFLKQSRKRTPMCC